MISAAVQGIPPLFVSSAETAKLDINHDALGTQERVQRSRSGDANKAEVAGNSVQADAKPTGQPDFSGISKKLQQVLGDNTFAQFSIDDGTKKIVVKILNAETHEVIKQLPPEESLKIAQYITNKLDSGNVTDAKV